MNECSHEDDLPLSDATKFALFGVTNVLASLGRAFVCLDNKFRIVHASCMLDEMLGAGAASELQGMAIEELLGVELFGEQGRLRNALENGQRREGWRAVLQCGDSPPRMVSITAAPVQHDASGVCDPRLTYVLLLRVAEEDGCTHSTTFYADAVACSASMQRIFRLIETLQQSDAPVLIRGESGTGKEVVARALHQNSPRSGGPFIAVNCAALPAELLETEIFGLARGSYSGAARERAGSFELASHGTLFLDEISDLAPGLQEKLLHALEARQFERLGESAVRSSRARILTATRTDLKEAIQQGTMREDLYYRLCDVTIDVPPLRERREDIAPLAQHLLARFAARSGTLHTITPEAMRVLLDYQWPGNVRELANVLEYASTVSRNQLIEPDDLPREIYLPDSARSKYFTMSQMPAVNEISDQEYLRILTALEEYHWRREDAARSLGMSRSTLWRKMRELHLDAMHGL